MRRICPSHAVPLKQQYACPGTTDDEGHVVTWGTWNTGVETPEGNFRVVDEDARPKFEAAGGLSLVPVPRKDLEAATFEGDGVYYAKPSTEQAVETWAILNKIVAGKVALIARGALRKGSGTEKLWRISSFNNFLVLREIRFPENLKETPDSPSTKVDKATYELVGQFVDKLTTEWDDFDASDAGAARLEAWLSDGTEVEGGIVQAKDAPTVDLKDLLAASLENM